MLKTVLPETISVLLWDSLNEPLSQMLLGESPASTISRVGIASRAGVRESQGHPLQLLLAHAVLVSRVQASRGQHYLKKIRLKGCKESPFLHTCWISFKALSQSALMSAVSVYFRWPALRWVAILRSHVTACIHKCRTQISKKRLISARFKIVVKQI